MKLLPLLCLLCLWFGPDSAQESKPVIVEVYAEAHLPCLPNLSEKFDTFDWKKDVGTEVFFYDDGHNNGTEGNLFQGRVLFSKAEFEKGTASITIKNTRLEDSGNYTCKILGPNGKEIHRRLIVGAAPKPYVTEIHQGNKRSLLECEVQGVPKPEVEWRNSAGEVLAKLTNVKEIKERFLTLYVNVTKNDNYTCVATQKSIFHQINATEYVRFQDDFVSVGEGDDVILPCSLDSKKNIKNMVFEWSKDQKKVYFYDRGQVEQDKHFKERVTNFGAESGNASIKIQKTQLSDSGRYTCHFLNMQQSHVSLHVVPMKGYATGSSDSLCYHCSVIVFCFFVWSSKALKYKF